MGRCGEWNANGKVDGETRGRGQEMDRRAHGTKQQTSGHVLQICVYERNNDYRRACVNECNNNDRRAIHRALQSSFILDCWLATSSKQLGLLRHTMTGARIRTLCRPRGNHNKELLKPLHKQSLQHDWYPCPVLENDTNISGVLDKWDYAKGLAARDKAGKHLGKQQLLLSLHIAFVVLGIWT